MTIILPFVLVLSLIEFSIKRLIYSYLQNKQVRVNWYFYAKFH